MKQMQHAFNDSPGDRTAMSQIMHKLEEKMLRKRVSRLTSQQRVNWTGRQDKENVFDVSWELPTDTSKGSSQNTYSSKRRRTR